MQPCSHPVWNPVTWHSSTSVKLIYSASSDQITSLGLYMTNSTHTLAQSMHNLYHAIIIMEVGV